MRLAAHQPDLLPYPGFWVKMARADLFDLAIWDQFRSRGYQRRVTMRGQWLSVPVQKCPTRTRIADVRLLPDAEQVLLDGVYGRYVGALRFGTVYGSLHDWVVEHAPWTHLWEMNLSLILWGRALLGVDTPLAIGSPPVGTGLAGIVSVLDQYPATTYLSGDGGRAYLGDDPERALADRGYALEWMDYDVAEPDSFLTPLMDGRDVL